jgi:hypothetical protein
MVHCLCVTLGGAREAAIAAQFADLQQTAATAPTTGDRSTSTSRSSSGSDGGGTAPSFSVTFSAGVRADRLGPSLEQLREEVGDVLQSLGWLHDERRLQELLRAIARCDAEQRKVLACTFAHLRAMRKMAASRSRGRNRDVSSGGSGGSSGVGTGDEDGGDSDGDLGQRVDIILEDNVRLVRHDAPRAFADFMAAVEGSPSRRTGSSEGRGDGDQGKEEGGRSMLWYAGFLGRPVDLRKVHRGDRQQQQQQHQQVT